MSIVKVEYLRKWLDEYMFAMMIAFIMLFFVDYNYSQVINGSFETAEGEFSTTGWRNYGGIPYSDPPVGGGNWSLELSSGCVWRYCSHYIPDTKDGDIFEIKFWAKTTYAYGSGDLSWSNHQYINFYITDSVWTYYNLIDTLKISNETDSIFFFISGGGGYAGMGGACFDLVEVNKIGNITSVDQEINSPDEFTLFQNYPNPFNPSTMIRYNIQERGMVLLKVFNIMGEEVVELVNEIKDAGSYSVYFNASEMSSGIYFYQLYTNQFSSTKKMLLLQ